MRSLVSVRLSSSTKTLALTDAGLSGLAALKNFLELGFDVIGFERHDYIGGLWQWTDDPNQTSVLKCK